MILIIIMLMIKNNKNSGNQNKCRLDRTLTGLKVDWSGRRKSWTQPNHNSPSGARRIIVIMAATKIYFMATGGP